MASASQTLGIEVAAAVGLELQRRAIIVSDLYLRATEGKTYVTRAAFVRALRNSLIDVETAESCALFSLMDTLGNDMVTLGPFAKTLTPAVASPMRKSPAPLAQRSPVVKRASPAARKASAAAASLAARPAFHVGATPAPLSAGAPIMPVRRGPIPSDGVHDAVRKLRAAAYVRGGIDLHTLFGKLDANRDGGLSLAELTSGIRRAGVTHGELADDQMGALFWAIDANHDGEVSEIEFTDYVDANAEDNNVVFTKASLGLTAKRSCPAAVFSPEGLPRVRITRRTHLGVADSDDVDAVEETIERRVLRELRASGVNAMDLFRLAARNGSHVYLPGLRRALESVHIYVPMEEAKRLFQIIDVDGEGAVNWPQFTALYGKEYAASAVPLNGRTTRAQVSVAVRNLIAASYTTGGCDLPALFRRFDVHGRTELGRGDFKRALLHTQSGNVAMRMNVEQVETLFDAVDVNHNGFVNEKELIDFVRQIAKRDGIEFRERKAASPRSRRSPHKGRSPARSPRKSTTKSPLAENTEALSVSSTDTPQHRVAHRILRDLKARAITLNDVFHRAACGDEDVSRNQLKRGFKECGVTLNDTDSLLLFSLLDWDGDGRVEWDEFEMLHRPKLLGASPLTRRATGLERVKLSAIVRKLLALAYTTEGVCLPLLFHHLDMHRRDALKFADFVRAIRRVHATEHAEKVDGHHHGNLTDGEMMYLFQAVDANGDGIVSSTELAHFVRLVAKEDGIEFNEVTHEQAIAASANKLRSAKLDAVQATARKLRALAYTANGTDLAGLFRHLDGDHNGVLNLKEFRHAIRMARVTRGKLTDDQIATLFDHIDVDQSGTIEIGEFLAFSSVARAKKQRQSLVREDGAAAKTMDESACAPDLGAEAEAERLSTVALSTWPDEETIDPVATVRSRKSIVQFTARGDAPAAAAARSALVTPSKVPAASEQSPAVDLDAKKANAKAWTTLQANPNSKFDAAVPRKTAWQWDLPIVASPNVKGETVEDSNGVRFVALEGEAGFFVYAEHWMAVGSGELRAHRDTILKARPVLARGLAKSERLAIQRGFVLRPLREPLATDDYLHWWVVVNEQDAPVESSAPPPTSVSAIAAPLARSPAPAPGVPAARTPPKPLPRWNKYQYTTSSHTKQGLTPEERRLGYKRSPEAGQIAVLRSRNPSRLSERMLRAARSTPSPVRAAPAPAAETGSRAERSFSTARNTRAPLTRDNVEAPDAFWEALKEVERTLSEC
jgi:Ca2+-binding EF-hand superfamily protein